MTTELTLRNQSQQRYIRALSQAWRNTQQVYDPSIWLTREPELEEKMLRDPEIAHAVGFRRHLIAGRQWTVQPRVEDDPASDVAVAVATELLDSIKSFTQARLNLAMAFLSGERFATIQMVPKTLDIGDGKPRTWLIPKRIHDHDKRMFRRVPKNDGTTVTAHWEKWDVAKGQWCPLSQEQALRTIRHVYQDDEGTVGHGRGLREALGWVWYSKQHVFDDSLKSADRFGGGMLVAKMDGLRAADGTANAEAMAAWLRVLKKARSENVLVFDKSDDIEVISGSSEGWQMLGELRREFKNAIFTLVLGANLTTGADEGGSYALAEVQENSTEALIQYDRETLEETLTDDLMGCIWHENYVNLAELGIANLKPRFSINQEKREDPLVRAQVAQALSGMGVNLAVQDVLEQTGFRVPQDGEPIVKRPEQPALPGFGGLV